MSMKSRILIIGGVGAGKTTLAHRLNGRMEPARKTQALCFDDCLIDTPGEYLENPFMYKNIIATVQQAECVLIVQDAHQLRNLYPPGMARSFNCKVLGVVTKADGDLKNIDYVLREFKAIGVEEPYFITSAQTGQGIDALKAYLVENGFVDQAPMIHK